MELKICKVSLEIIQDCPSKLGCKQEQVTSEKTVAWSSKLGPKLAHVSAGLPHIPSKIPACVCKMDDSTRVKSTRSGESDLRQLRLLPLAPPTAAVSARSAQGLNKAQEQKLYALVSAHFGFELLAKNKPNTDGKLTSQHHAFVLCPSRPPKHQTQTRDNLSDCFVGALLLRATCPKTGLGWFREPK